MWGSESIREKNVAKLFLKQTMKSRRCRVKGSYSLQPGFAQGRNVPLNFRWVLVGYPLLKHC